MEAACINQILDTSIIYCIWYLVTINLTKNLWNIIRSNWTIFISQFWLAYNVLTIDEFEQQWIILRDSFIHSQITADAYLQRLYECHTYWTWSWIGTWFTMGIQLTQRVESINYLIKHNINKTISLKYLFEIIEQKLSDNKLTNSYLNYQIKNTNWI